MAFPATRPPIAATCWSHQPNPLRNPRSSLWKDYSHETNQTRNIFRDGPFHP